MIQHRSTAMLQARRGKSAARAKLEELLHEGRRKALAVLERVSADRPEDRLVRAGALGFDAITSAEDALALRAGDFAQGLHPHALRQVSQRVSFPWAFADHLLEPERRSWGAELVADNLSRLYRETFRDDPEQLLVRSVRGRTLGVLSSRYKRLDASIVLDFFGKACLSVGAVPYDGVALDVRVGLRAVLGEVFEPIPGEVMAFGVSLTSSDFGAGSLNLDFFMLRLACLNGLTLSRVLRRVHLGRQIEDDSDFSERTRELDATTVGSAIQDIVQAQLGAARLDEVQHIIRNAADTRVTPGEIEALVRRGLTKTETKAVSDAFVSPDVVHLPPGESRWRLSQAISWVAHGAQSTERRMELESIAGAAALA